MTPDVVTTTSLPDVISDMLVRHTPDGCDVGVQRKENHLSDRNVKLVRSPQSDVTVRDRIEKGHVLTPHLSRRFGGRTLLSDKIGLFVKMSVLSHGGFRWRLYPKIIECYRHTQKRSIKVVVLTSVEMVTDLDN